MSADRIAELYETHCREELAAVASKFLFAAAVACFVYFAADVLAEGLQASDIVYYSCLFVVLAAAAAVGKSGGSKHLDLWLLAFDISFTLILAGRLLVPTTTVSGTALVISLKMLAVVLVLPWRARFFLVSVLAALSGYLLFVILRISMGAELPALHEVVGPVIAGFLSLIGAAIMDRYRRSLFEQTLRLTESERRLRTLLAERDADAAMSQSLARVANVIVGSINKRGLLERLAEATAREFAADFSHVLLFDRDDDSYRVVAGWGDPTEVWEAIRMMRFPRAAIPLATAALDARGVVQSGPGFAEPAIPPGVQEPYGITLAMVVRLEHEGMPLGLIGVGFRGRTEPFSPHQEKLATAIARVASVGLTNATLFDELERANRIKSDFLASMSHELRTPLNVILGYHELLLAREFGDLSPGQADAVARLQKTSTQLLDMVEAILDLSRLEVERVDLELERFDVESLLESLRHSFEATPGDARVAIEWRIPDRVPRITSDATKLRVVLRNLISNALKFDATGPVVVAAEIVDEGLEIRVSDRGIGIDTQAQARIFEPFSHADDTIAATYGGAGLGLHIARRLVHLLGGILSMESEKDRGSTFRVWLPWQPDAQPSARAMTVQ